MACCSEFSEDEVDEVVEDDDDEEDDVDEVGLVMEEAGDDNADECGEIVDELPFELVGDIELLMKGTFGKNVCCLLACAELSLLFLAQLTAAELSLVL